MPARSPFSRAAFVAVALAFVIAEAAAATREDAVQAARAGRLDEAIATLRALERTSDDPRVRFDLAVVLQWAARPREATDVFEKLPSGIAVPAYVREAMIGAYRDQRRFAEAALVARAGMAADPGDPNWPRLLALVLADEGKTDEAAAVLAPLMKSDRVSADTWLARGYVAQRANDRLGAVRAFAEARRLAPGNTEAAQALARAMTDIGAPHGAAGALGAAPLDLRARQAALQLRWAGQITERDPRRRFEATDRTLAELDQLIAEASKATPVDTALMSQLRRDRAVALRQRERWAEAVAAIAALRAEGDPIPPYVRQAEADALLALRRPAEARRAYEEVVAADPRNRDARVGRFFAEVEDEDFDAAFATIDGLAAEGTPGKRQPRETTPEPDADWLDAQILSAMARNYADMNAAAWEQLEPLAAGAPAVGYLRSNVGAVAAARGWPRRAEEEVRIASSLAPEDRGVQVALADSAMRRRQWPEARERIAALEALFPEDASVQRVVRDLQAHDMYELRMDVNGRWQSGGASQAPGPGASAAARLYSPPLAERWRAFADGGYYTAKPPEGRATRNIAGAGAEYRGIDYTVEAGAWQNWGTVSKGSVGVAATWLPDDHWSLSADAGTFVLDTPLRALLYGITANGAGATVGYAWHESTSFSANVRGLDFTDGNQRRSVRAVFAQRIVDRPRFDVTLRPEVYASRNSLENAPYFNPSQDFAATLAVDVQHVIWREYERSFGQRVVASAGSYWQQGYGTGGIGGVLYEQAWRSDPRTEFRYGVEWNRRLYDGVPERTWILFASLVTRF
jgi:poly-beta-1,6 N-acetyl-D-glucosamine export porin PgaA